MARVIFDLEDEHTAMLDAICIHGAISRSAMAKSLLIAVLEDVAACHGAATDPDSNVIVLRHWRRRG